MEVSSLTAPKSRVSSGIFLCSRIKHKIWEAIMRCCNWETPRELLHVAPICTRSVLGFCGWCHHGRFVFTLFLLCTPFFHNGINISIMEVCVFYWFTKVNQPICQAVFFLLPSVILFSTVYGLCEKHSTTFKNTRLFTFGKFGMTVQTDCGKGWEK